MKKIELVYVIFIRTTPKKLWDAITRPEFTRQYWGGSENVSDWKKGSKWELVMEGEKDPVMVVGKVLESKPPKRLVLTWADPDDVADKSQVTYEIEPLESDSEFPLSTFIDRLSGINSNSGTAFTCSVITNLHI
jgi:uncharacterized protein YndB with AHSA1/START domain